MRHFQILGQSAALILAGSLLAGCSTWHSVSGFVSDYTDDIFGAPQTAQARQAEIFADSLTEAKQARHTGDKAKALHLLSQLVIADPDNPAVLSEYGKLLVETGNGSEAVAFLSRAALLSPNDWTLYSALGVAYDQAGATDKARLVYEAALKLKPGEAVVLNNYALSRAMAGDIAGAQTLIRMAATTSAEEKVAGNMALIQRLAAAGSQTDPAAARHAVAAVQADDDAARTAQATQIFQPMPTPMPRPAQN